jgi:hypothetical protein
MIIFISSSVGEGASFTIIGEHLLVIGTLLYVTKNHAGAIVTVPAGAARVVGGMTDTVLGSRCYLPSLL